MQLQFISPLDIVFHILVYRLWPVWLCMAILMGTSYRYRKRLGLYGQLYDSGVGLAGVGILSFWFFVAVFSRYVAPFNPLEQIAVMRNALPGEEPGEETPADLERLVDALHLKDVQAELEALAENLPADPAEREQHMGRIRELTVLSQELRKRVMAAG